MKISPFTCVIGLLTVISSFVMVDTIRKTQQIKKQKENIQVLKDSLIKNHIVISELESSLYLQRKCCTAGLATLDTIILRRIYQSK